MKGACLDSSDVNGKRDSLLEREDRVVHPAIQSSPAAKHGQGRCGESI